MLLIMFIDSPAGNRRFLGKSLNFWQKHQILRTDSFLSIFQNKMKTPAQFSKNGRFLGIFQDGRQIPNFSDDTGIETHKSLILLYNNSCTGPSNTIFALNYPRLSVY